MQDEGWALGKSKNWSDLLKHTATYSMCWLWFASLHWIIIKPFPDVPLALWTFVIITFVAHTITDYFTSRIVNKKFTKGEYGTAIPNTGAFTIIGIDQVLHYIQLFTTYYLLK